MKYLFKISPPIWPIFIYEFSLIKELIKKKKKLFIWVLSGDKKKISFCHANPSMNRLVCLACTSKLKNTLNQLNGKYELIKDFDKNKTLTIKFRNFFNKNKILDLNKISYQKIDLGKGVESTMLTLFKSKYNKDYKKDFRKKLLEQSFYILEAIKKIKKKHNLKKTYLFNGRHFNYRPILKYLNKIKSPIECYDTSNYSEKIIFSKNNYPHNLILRSKNLLKIKISTKQKKLEIAGRRFFKKRLIENRSNNLIDNYEFSQTNILPKGFDKKKLNIGIFNTSLWEFKSIVENKKFYLFKDDLDFLEFLLKKYKKNQDIFFYFRCHPNMILEKKYLYKIKNIANKFDNLEFIGPASKISTKNLLKHSDITVNFGSSVALESAFFGKKVITLAPSIFLKFTFQKVFKIKKDFTNFIDKILILKKKDKLKFDQNAHKAAIIAAGCAHFEGKIFREVKTIDRYKQIYRYKNQNIILRSSILYHVLYMFINLTLAIKKLINFTLLDFNLSIKKLFSFIKRFINIYKRSEDDK